MTEANDTTLFRHTLSASDIGSREFRVEGPCHLAIERRNTDGKLQLVIAAGRAVSISCLTRTVTKARTATERPAG